jgi:hypothetical protein
VNLSTYILISCNCFYTHTGDSYHEASLCTPKQVRTHVMDDADDVAREDSDVELEFTDDEDGFLMMTPTDMMS